MFDKAKYNRDYNRRMYRLNPGRVKSWGALWRQENPEYSVWRNMNRRCSEKTFDNYENYGGRGIKVLYKSYQEFISDVGHRPSSDLTIDRINVNGHYEKGNCRWSTYSVQNKNRRKFQWSKKSIHF
jgi:hypothetical protein